MLVNYTSIYTTNRDTIENLVGLPFTLNERKQLSGILSALLPITEVSLQIYNILVTEELASFCQIELRTKGILIHLGPGATQYTLPIPYYKLVLYKGKSEEYSIHKDTYFVKFEVAKDDVKTHQFLKKVTNQKSNQRLTYIDDL